MRTLTCMSKMKVTKDVLSQLLSTIDEVELKKTSNRMMVAAKIGSALKDKGISQKAFAKMVGKTESEVSSWLSGDRNFTIDTLTEISIALNITLIDTEVQSACSVPTHVLLSEKCRGTGAEIAKKSCWTYSLSYIDCRTKTEKVG